MINKGILKQVVIQQKNDLNIEDEIIQREIFDKILKGFEDNRILILTGIRRCGKSTLLKQLMKVKNKTCYVNFEDERFIEFNAKDFEILNEVLVDVYEEPSIYFFDEIQNIDKFETFVRRLQDQGKKIIITGSNASLLSKELGTRLTGRYKAFEVYPFSYKEFLRFKKIKFEKDWVYLTEKKVKLVKLFEEYLNEGGFPEYLKNKDPDYIRTVYENILYRDIIARYSIKKQKVLKELVNILTTNIASLFTYNALKNNLGVSNSITIKEYIEYLNNSYLFFELQKFEYSIKKQLSVAKKIFVIDLAFNKIGGFNFSKNKGKMLENLVFVELKRRKKEIYYWKNKRECDFVIKEGLKVKEVIQVCYELNEENRGREIEGLVEALKEFKLKEGLILTNDKEDEFMVEGKKIVIKPVWKWLVE